MPKHPDAYTPIPKTYREKKAPKRRKPFKPNPIPGRTLSALAARCGGACEGRTPACQGAPKNAHHRRKKGQGVDHSLPNLLALCGTGTTGCHGFAHAHEDWSRRHGLILGAGDDPELLVVGCPLECDIDHRRPVSALPEGNPK